MFMVQSYNILTYYTFLVLALLTLKKKQWCKAVVFSIAALSAADFNRLNGCISMAVLAVFWQFFYSLKIYTLEERGMKCLTEVPSIYYLVF